jgi:hypothetical protein
MKRRVGLWIDHRKAVIVIIAEDREEIKEISSDLEGHVRFTAGSSSESGSAEDVRDRQFGNRLNAYYDKVVAAIGRADSIQIFGPGEAKGELRTRLAGAGLADHLLAVETVDKMTDRQIAAKVRDHAGT